MTNQQNKLPEHIQTAKVRQSRRISPFWLLPIIALIIGATLFFQIIKEQGDTITITFAHGDGLVANKTQIRYQGLQIGVVKKVNFTEDLKKVEVQANIYPEAKTVLRENTKFWLVQPNASLAGISGLDTLISGNYITLQPGDGSYQDEFTAETEGPIAQINEGDLLIHLISNDLGSISVGSSVFYKKMPVGKVMNYRFTKDQKEIEIDIVIEKAYTNLVKKESHFWNISGIKADVGMSGIKLDIDSLASVVQGAVAFDSPEQSETATQNEKFTLYPNLQAAQSGVEVDMELPNITLKTETLPSISQHSVVLYRQYEVGKILDIRPMKSHFDVDVYIYPKYRHLLTDKSLFWVESAAQIDITPKGISIQATPISRSLKGAISFDNSGSSKNTTLYENELRAKSAGQVITLTANDAKNLSKGMSLRYMGLSVGEIESITLDTKANKIIAKALMNPSYMNIVAKEGSQFQVISPKISAGGIDNLDSLLQPYIDIDVGNGARKTQFPLNDSNNEQQFKVSSGFPITLEAGDASNLSVGAPVMYRGVDVGKIKNMELNSLGDRVLIHILITHKYAHLVRQNSEFWVSSGYSAGLGWSGIEVNTGSMQQLLKGGIAFSTPSGTVVQPQAKANQRFLLQERRPNDAKQWNSGAMPTN